MDMEQIRPDRIIAVISGPSGVGKDTIYGLLSKKYPERFIQTVSHTTRAPRDGERDGVNYHFVTKERFDEMKADGQFLESAEFCGNYYGTSHAEVRRCLDSGKIAILIIEVQGAETIRKYAFDHQDIEVSLVTIFIRPPSLQELEKRLRERKTDNDEQIQKRLVRARFEISQSIYFNYTVSNTTVDETADNLWAIFTAESLRSIRRPRYSGDELPD